MLDIWRRVVVELGLRLNVFKSEILVGVAGPRGRERVLVTVEGSELKQAEYFRFSLTF